MADELGSFLPYLGGDDKAVLLLKTLEGLASADETIVREAVLMGLVMLISLLR